MKNIRTSSDFRILRVSIAAVLGTAAIIATPAHAFEFGKSDAFSGSWDTTLSYGTAFRIQDQDCNLVAVADGGCGRSPNIDDGNINYNTGSYSRAAKVVTELALNSTNYGVF